MKQFKKWKDNNCTENCAIGVGIGCIRCVGLGTKEDAWKAALELVLKLCPTNEKATFANQGQGTDGYTELANYKAMYKKLKEELGDE